MSTKLYTRKEKSQFIENILDICSTHNISLKQLAKLAKLDVTTIFNWKKGTYQMTSYTLINTAQNLISINFPLEDIFYNLKISSLGKNILKLCATRGISIKELGELINIKEIACIYSWIYGSSSPSLITSIKFSQFLIVENIPIEEIFENVKITTLGTNLLLLSAKRNIPINKLPNIFNLELVTITNWIYGNSQISLISLHNIAQSFKQLEIPLEELLVNTNVSSFGIKLLNLCTQANISTNELSKKLEIKVDTISCWIYGISKPKNLLHFRVLQTFIELNINSEDVFSNTQITKFGINICVFCAQNHISITELANLLKLNIKTLLSWIYKEFNPSHQTLTKLAQAFLEFNTPLEEIFNNILSSYSISILRFCIKNNMSISKLSKKLNIEINHLLYNKQPVFNVIPAFIVSGIPIEDVFENIEIKPIVINLFTICFKNNISIKELSIQGRIPIKNLYNWSMGSQPQFQYLINILEAFIKLNVSLDELFINADITDIGKTILKYCALRETTIEALSEFIGVNKVIIHHWIHGKSNPSKIILIHISKFFNAPIEEVSSNQILPLNEKFSHLCDGTSVTKLADTFGVSRKTIYNWINNQHTPMDITIEFIESQISKKQ